MNGPISTTLAQPLARFDLIPGIVGDRFGLSEVIARRLRVACVEEDRSVTAGELLDRLALVLDQRSAEVFGQRSAFVASLPPRLAKVPTEEKC